MKKSIYTLILLVFPLFLMAQSDAKQPYKSYNNIQKIAIIDDSVWAVTKNGLVQKDKTTGETLAIFNFSNSPIIHRVTALKKGTDGRTYFLEYIDYQTSKWYAFDGCEWELVQTFGAGEAIDFVFDAFGEPYFSGHNATPGFQGLRKMTTSPNQQIYALEAFNTVYFVPCNDIYDSYTPRLKKWNFDHWETIVEGSSDSTIIGSHLVFHPDGTVWLEPNRQVVDNQIVVHPDHPASAADFAFDQAGTLWTVPHGDIEIDEEDNIFWGTDDGLFKRIDDEWQPLLTEGLQTDIANGIYFDSLGNQWLEAGGLHQIKNGIFTLHDSTNSPVPAAKIEWQFVDKFQKTWFVFAEADLEDARLLQFDGTVWTDFSSDVFLNYDFQNIQKDSADNIWFFYENTADVVACRYNYLTFENFGNLDSFDLGTPVIPDVIWALDTTTVLKIEDNDTTRFEFIYPFYSAEDLVFTEINQSGNVWIAFQVSPLWVSIFWFDGEAWQPDVYALGHAQFPRKTLSKGSKIWIMNGMTPHYEDLRPTMTSIDNGIKSNVLLPGCGDSYPNDHNAGNFTAELNETTEDIAMIYNYSSSNQNGPWCAPTILCTLRVFTIFRNGIFTNTSITSQSSDKKITDFKFDPNGDVWYWGDETPMRTSATTPPYPTIFSQPSGCNIGKTIACVPQGTRRFFNYQWSNGSTNPVQIFDDVTNFDLTISTSAGAIFDTSFTVAGVPVLTVAETLNLPSDDTATDGSIALNITGGTPPYEVIWSNGSTDFEVENLATGFYQVTITDALNCQKELEYALAMPLVIDLQTTDLQCFEQNNGAASLLINGGISPYQILFSTGDTLANIENLAAGTYQVAVQDAGIFSEILTFEINQPNVLTTTQINTPETCQNAQNGSLEIIPDGGTPPYEIEWNNGATTLQITDLSAGNFAYTLTDAEGCTFAQNVFLEAIPNLSATASFVHADFGESNGEITVFPQGGTGNYTLNWGNGMMTNVIENLPSGTYSVTISDGTDCPIVESFDVLDQLLIDYETIAPSCLGNDDGEIHLDPKGGIPPYEIEWWDFSFSTETLTNLTADNYIVKVSDSGSFSKFTSITVADGPMLLLDFSGVNPQFGEANGEISAMPIDGLAPYEYLWNTGATSSNLTDVAGGNYSVTITDSQGCTGEDYAFLYSIAMDNDVGQNAIFNGQNPVNQAFLDKKERLTSILETEVLVFPNPFQNTLFIDFKNEKHAISNLQIFNVFGQKIPFILNENVEKSVLKIETSEWSSGAYFIHFKSNDHTFVKKIVKP